MLNEVAAIFNFTPIFSYESASYCTLSMISREDFAEFLIQYPKIQKQL